MILLLEGIDKVGKTTQMTKIQPLLNDKSLMCLHYMSIKGFEEHYMTKLYSKEMYSDMFRIMRNEYKNINFLVDRSHIGEVVYSPMYRGYSGEYVYDIEKGYCNSYNNAFWDEIYLITFIDKPENTIGRDDGLSFTTSLKTKQKEINAFIEATEKSHIKNKIIINIDGKDEDTVFKEIKKFLNK